MPVLEVVRTIKDLAGQLTTLALRGASVQHTLR